MTTDPPLFTTAYRHPYLRAVTDFLLARIHRATPESILILAGPSHVGKSTGAKLIRRMLKEHYAKELEGDPSFVPYASADLIWERKVGISFKDLYRELLVSLNENIGPLRSVGANTRSDATSDLRRRLSCVLVTRRTKAIFLDEGQQLAAGTSARTAQENLRGLKNLAVIIKIPIVVSATYEVLKHVVSSPEIEARVTVAHLPPYADDEKEIGDFQGAVSWAEDKLQSRYPGFTFGDRRQTMRATCGGRIGTLMRWLVNSETDCWASKDRNLNQWLEVNTPGPKRILRFESEDQLGTRLLGNLCSNGFNGVFSPRGARN